MNHRMLGAGLALLALAGGLLIGPDSASARGKRGLHRGGFAPPGRPGVIVRGHVGGFKRFEGRGWVGFGRRGTHPGFRHGHAPRWFFRKGPFLGSPLFRRGLPLRHRGPAVIVAPPRYRIWVPGAWHWTGYRWVWAPGHWRW